MIVPCMNCGNPAIVMIDLIICAHCQRAMTEVDALGYLRDKDHPEYYSMTVNERVAKVWGIEVD